MTREHEVIDDEGVRTRREQLGQLHLARCPVRAESIENIILNDGSTGRQSAPGNGQRFGRAPMLDLLLQQPVAGSAVFAGFAWKCNAHCLTPFSCVRRSKSTRSGGNRCCTPREYVWA